MQDKYDCIVCFKEDQETVAGVIARVEEIFTDSRDNQCIKLSSVHKAKGLEASRVFVLAFTLRDTSPEEMNIQYVAITRAKDVLVWVRKEGRS